MSTLDRHTTSSPPRPESEDERASSDGLVFEHFVRDHIGTVRKLALVRVGPDEADDIVTDAFVAAWQLYEAEKSTPTEAWLLGTTINQCRMRIRSNRAWFRRLRQGRDPVDGWLSFDDDAIERVDATNAHVQILAAFRQLPPAEREVIALAAWADLTPVEISEVLGRPRATVRSLLFRARNHLATALQSKGPSHE